MQSHDHPDPADLFSDPAHPRPQEGIQALVDAGLVTRRRAEVYVRRRLEAEPRQSVADDLGISVNTVDEHLREAKEQIAAARETVAVLDAYRAPELPSACNECGAALGGRYSEDEHGDALCLDCAGVGTVADGRR